MFNAARDITTLDSYFVIFITLSPALSFLSMHLNMHSLTHELRGNGNCPVLLTVDAHELGQSRNRFH